jgi:L-alanine-DL-glutamate epimerase-like enolase superfamily enzyme
VGDTDSGTPQDGYVKVAEGPGFGVEVNGEYTRKGELFFDE